MAAQTNDEDRRPRVPIGGKAVNLAQLADELGTALSASDTEIVVADPDTSVSAQQLQAGLSAHTPDPDYAVRPEDKQARLARAKAPQVLAGTATFTATEVQKILAAVLLRGTR